MNSAWDRIYRPLKDCAAARALSCRRPVRAARGRRATASPPSSPTARASTGDLLVAADGIHSTRAADRAARGRSRAMPAMSPGAAFSTRATCRRTIHATAVRSLHLLPARGRADHRPADAGRRSRRAARRAPLSLGLVPAGRRGRRPRRSSAPTPTGNCHGTSIPPPLIRPRSDRRGQGACRRRAGAAARARGGADAQTAAAADLSISSLAAHGAGAGRAAGRCRLRRTAACRRRRHQGGARRECLADALGRWRRRRRRSRATTASAAPSATRSSPAAARLGAYLEAQHKPPEARSPEERAHDPAAVLREYGAAALTPEALGSAE